MCIIKIRGKRRSIIPRIMLSGDYIKAIITKKQNSLSNGLRSLKIKESGE